MNTLAIHCFSIRGALLLACLVVAGCNIEKNWQDQKAYVTIGGTVSGLTSGSVQLVNNGKGKITVATDGSFIFPLSIANGSGYAVSVSDQPSGLSCSVINGTATATADVSNVSVSCVPYVFTRRSLPSIYNTGKAVNYSAYRTSGGPAASEIPTDAEILQDLALLNDAGYNLLRLFGAAPPTTDVVSEKILQLAYQHYPNINFQLGVFLGGLTTCGDPINDKNIAYLITKLSKYPNVVSISVGNETSFYSKYMPVTCLKEYIRTIRSQVTQPVTTDDDFTFYAGLSWSGGDRAGEKPDEILPLIDFASIHLYPFSSTTWNWQQTIATEGSPRAKASMETSLEVAKDWFGRVSTYLNDHAQPMEIVVGETGWKSRQTNFGSNLETYLANPVNAKWYTDLLYGNSAKGYTSWQGSANGPTTIFYFEAFDETWKGTDDGWGLWDINRQPRYALCDIVGSNACNADLYQGAGYFNLSSVVPSTAPSTVIPADAVKVYTDAVVTTGFDTCPNWGQATICIPEQTIADNKLIGYSNLNYQGLDWFNYPIDVSAKSSLHVDLWTPNLASIDIYLISAVLPSSGTIENKVTKTLLPNSWNSIDIPLSSFQAKKSAINQIKLVGTGDGTVYLDNLYFY